MLADATQEQFEKEDGAAAGEEEAEEDGATKEEEAAVPEAAPEEAETPAGAEIADAEKQGKEQKQGRLRPATEAVDTEEAAAEEVPSAEPTQDFLEEWEQEAAGPSTIGLLGATGREDEDEAAMEVEAEEAEEAAEEAEAEAEAMRDELESELANWQLQGGGATAEAVWRQFEARTNGLAQELCEQLRLILEATVKSRLQGDYRTGKRISMRKVSRLGQGAVAKG